MVESNKVAGGRTPPSDRTETMHLNRPHIIFACAVAAVLLFSGIAAASAAPSRTDQLRSQLNEISDEFRRAGAAYDKAYWAFDSADADYDRASKRMAKLKKELAGEQKQLSKRVATWYRTDNLGFLEVLLLSENFEDFATRLDYVQRVSNADAAAIDRIEKTLVKIRRERAALEKTRAARAKKVVAFKKRRDALQAQLSRTRTRYNALQAQLAAAARAEKGSGYVPASGRVNAVAGPNGMVFPVAGPNYYSDTWGASRGGGRRRHKGTDIMASTGTPVVATLSGSVTVRRGNTAGLWIILRANNGWQFWYMHLNTTTVPSGSRVSAGQQIGTVGYSGNASANAPHLHYEIHPGGGAAVNPYPYLRKMQGR